MAKVTRDYTIHEIPQEDLIKYGFVPMGGDSNAPERYVYEQRRGRSSVFVLAELCEPGIYMVHAAIGFGSNGLDERQLQKPIFEGVQFGEFFQRLHDPGDSLDDLM